MGMTPPPLPPQGEDNVNANNLPSANRQKSAVTKPQVAPQAPKEVHTDIAEDIDFEVVPPKKSNRLLWIVPAVVILLLIGGGIYAYFYIQAKHEKEQKELKEEQAAQEEARLKREQEIADSIAAEEAFQNEQRLGFTSPNLETFNLKGHVKSVMTTCSSNPEGYLPLFLEVFNERNISFDYDGSFTQLPSELSREDIPSINYNGGYLSEVRYTYNYDADDTNNYSFTWTGDHITSMKQSIGYASKSTDSYTSFDGNDPTSISQSFSWTSPEDSRNSTKFNLTYTITYSDRDEYGNWTKANVSYTGKYVHNWTERQTEYSYGYSYYNDIPKSETNDINCSFTITRYIDYYDYVPEKH